VDLILLQNALVIGAQIVISGRRVLAAVVTPHRSDTDRQALA
jgi:hypothetical protein